MWVATAPLPFGLLGRGCLDSRGGCHLVTSGLWGAWRVPGKCSPRLPDATSPPGCEGVQPGSPSVCCLPLRQWPGQGRSRAERCERGPGHDPRRASAVGEPRCRSAVASGLPPGRSSLGRLDDSVTGRNAPQERARLSLARPAPPAGRAEGRGGEGTAGRREGGRPAADEGPAQSSVRGQGRCPWFCRSAFSAGSPCAAVKALLDQVGRWGN